MVDKPIVSDVEAQMEKEAVGPDDQGKMLTTQEPVNQMQEGMENTYVPDWKDKVGSVVISKPFQCIGYTAIFLFNILPFIAITIGIIYIKHEDCPAAPIAGLIIATGVLAIMVTLIQIYMRRRDKLLKEIAESGSDTTATNVENQTQPRRIKVNKKKTWQYWVAWFVGTAKTVVFAFTLIEIYKLYPNVVYDSSIGSEYYCNKTLYLFSFWTVTTFFIILMAALVIMCCLITCAMAAVYFSKKD